MLNKMEDIIFSVYILGIIGVVIFVFLKYLKLFLLVMIPIILWVGFLIILANKGYQGTASFLAIVSIIVFFGYCSMNSSDAIPLNELYPQKAYPPDF